MKKFYFKCLVLFIVVLFPIINCSQMTQSDRDKCRNGVEPPDDVLFSEPSFTKSGDVYGFCQVLPTVQVITGISSYSPKFSKQETDIILSACLVAMLRLRHCDRKSNVPNLDLTRADE